MQHVDFHCFLSKLVPTTIGSVPVSPQSLSFGSFSMPFVHLVLSDGSNASLQR